MVAVSGPVSLCVGVWGGGQRRVTIVALVAVVKGFEIWHKESKS